MCEYFKLESKKHRQKVGRKSVFRLYARQRPQTFAAVIKELLYSGKKIKPKSFDSNRIECLDRNVRLQARNNKGN